MKPSKLVGLAAVVVSAAACDENPESEVSYGTVQVSTSAPSVQAFTTVDTAPWSVRPTKFLMNISAVNVTGLDGVLSASATAQIVDHVAAGAKVLIDAPVRVARPWEKVDFQVGPASVDSALLDGVNAADADAMKAAGASLWLEFQATRGLETKTLKLPLTSDTIYSDCEGDLGGVVVKGLIVPKDGVDNAELIFRATNFLSDTIDGNGSSRFDAFAAADADANGEITLEELSAITLDTARLTGGAYDPGVDSEIADLGAWVQALAPAVFQSFRQRGTCVATPAEAEE